MTKILDKLSIKKLLNKCLYKESTDEEKELLIKQVEGLQLEITRLRNEEYRKDKFILDIKKELWDNMDEGVLEYEDVIYTNVEKYDRVYYLIDDFDGGIDVEAN